MAAIVFGSYIRGGTFVSDDWATVDAFRHVDGGGPAALIRALKLALPDKPLLPYVLSAFPTFFGTDRPARFLAASAALSVVTAALFAALLLTLGARRWLAVAAGALAVVFPWSDSTRFWPAAAANNVAVCLLLVGLIVGVRNSRRLDGALAFGVECGVAALLAASVLTYQMTAGVALLAGLGYFFVLPARSALWRWTLGAVPVGLAVVHAALSTTKASTGPGQWIRHLGTVLADAGRLELRALLPIAVPDIARLVIAVVAALLVLRVWRAIDGEGRRRVRSSLTLMAFGYLLIVVGIAPTLPLAWFTPLSEALDNRANLVSMYGAVIAVLGLASLLVAVFEHFYPGEPRAAVLAGCLALTAVGGQYLQRVDADATRWLGAAQERGLVLASVAQGIPSLPRDHVLYVSGHRGVVSEKLPVFADTWDLGSALRLHFDDRTLRAYPVFTGAQFSCDADGMRPLVLPGLHWDQSSRGPMKYDAPHYDRDHGAPYGHITFFDVRTYHRVDIVDRTVCVAFLPYLDLTGMGP